MRVERQTLQWSLDYPFDLDIAQFQAALAKVAQFEQSAGPAHAETAPSPSGDYIQLLRTVVNSYAGDLLPSCYDEWVRPREQLRQDFLTSLQKLVNAFEKAGELGPAILYAQRLVRHDTLREENYRGLMRLHLANGDPAGAIDIYRHCVRVLKRDLNMEPSRMTQELARKAKEVSGAGSEGQKPVAGGKVGPKSGLVPTPARPSICPLRLPRLSGASGKSCRLQACCAKRASGS